MKQIAFILRNHREELWRRWAACVKGRVSDEYYELLASPLGERLARGLVEELLTLTQAEEYELPAVRRRLESECQEEVRRRLDLGFELLDIVRGLQCLELAVVDVLGDALVQGELPPAGETLVELRALSEHLHDKVCDAVAAGCP